jgi:uncharacterized membrane protein HdeD (DUF308 family)
MRTDIPERTNVPEPGGGALQLLRREAGRWWWAPLVAGVIWFLIAWLVLRMNVTSLATVGVLVGIVLLVAALNEVALAGFVTGGWKVAHYLLAAVFLLGAVWAFVRPVNTLFALASVLGLLLLLQGAFYIVRGVALRGVSPFWWLELFSGVLITALGIWVSVSDRVWDLAARAVFILVWVGIMAVLRGISNFALAFSMHWFARRGLDREPHREAAADTPPHDVPVQGHRAPAEEPRQQERPETPSAPSRSKG